MAGYGWLCGVEDKVLDKSALAGVVDHVEIGFASAVRRPDLKPERMKVVAIRVSCKGDALGRALSVRGVEPESAVGLRVAQRAHDDVPCLAPGIAAEDHMAGVAGAIVVDVPEDAVLAVFQARRIKGSAVAWKAAGMVVASGEGMVCKDYVGEGSGATVCEDALGR